MPLPQLWDLLKYWRDFPPAHVLLRGYVGWKGPADEIADAHQPFQMPAGLGDVPRASHVPAHIMQVIEENRRKAESDAKRN
jgi:hypothetical protein